MLLQPQRRRDGVAHRGAVVERREFAEPRAVAEALLLASCGLEGEPGLADAADPGQRHQRALAQGGGDAQHLLLAADEAGRAPRQIGDRTVRPTAGPAAAADSAWFAVEDLLVHPAQRGLGIDAQLVDEPVAHLPVGVERVGLPAAAVLGEHQLPGQAFVERMGVQRRGELAEQLRVPSGTQRDVVAVQYDRKPLGFQGGADVVQPWGVEGRERLAAPQVQCAIEEGCGMRRVSGPAGLGDQAAGSGAGRPTRHRSTTRSRPARGRSGHRRTPANSRAAGTDSRPGRYEPGAAARPPTPDRPIRPPGRAGSRRRARQPGRTAGGHGRCRATGRRVDLDVAE